MSRIFDEERATLGSLPETTQETTEIIGSGPLLQGGDTTPPAVRLISPNGGELLQPNQQFLIQWQSSDNVGVVAHDVKFSRDSGATFTDIATALAGSVQSLQWTVPNLNTTQAAIRVVARDAAGNQAGDRSDSPFSIQVTDAVPPTVRVIAHQAIMLVTSARSQAD